MYSSITWKKATMNAPAARMAAAKATIVSDCMMMKIGGFYQNINP
jgi:hypothetical protein